MYRILVYDNKDHVKFHTISVLVKSSTLFSQDVSTYLIHGLSITMYYNHKARTGTRYHLGYFLLQT